MAEDRMRILGKGLVWVAPTSDSDKSEIGSYWNAVKKYLTTGDDSDLASFEGRVIEGYELETDPEAIELWAQRGDLDFEDIYEGD